MSFRATDRDDAALSITESVVLSVIPASGSLFSDLFSDGDGWRSRWTIVNDSTDPTNWSVSNGVLLQRNYLFAYNQSYHLGTYALLTDTALASASAYRFSVDITPQTNGVDGQREGNDVGIMFLYADAGNYYRVSLNARYGFTRFEKRTNGVFETLAVNAIGYVDDQPTTLTVDVSEDAIVVLIDGDAVFAEASPTIPQGAASIALYCQDRATFDNVRVAYPGTDPMVAIVSPLAYSVAMTPLDGTTLSVSAVTVNRPPGAEVVFTLGGSETIASGSGSLFSAQFFNVAMGDHDLTAELRDAGNTTLDLDINAMVGVGGDYTLTVGDSITNGVGDQDPANNDSADGRIVAIQGYQAVLADALSLSTGRPQIVFNEGIGGDRASDLSGRIASILERHPRANAVLLIIGTNGSSGNADDPADFKTAVEGAAFQIDDIGGKRLWLAKTLPTYLRTDPTSLDHARNLVIAEFNIKIEEIATADSADNTFLGPDFFDTFLTLGDPLVYYDDYLHPSDSGYQVIADGWHTELGP